MRRLIVDLSSVLWMSLLAGKDKEHGYEVEFEGRKVLVNSAEFGYENAVNHLVAVLDDLRIPPRNMILVEEGKDAKALRKWLYPGYKEGRERPQECYTEFNKLKATLTETFLNLGAQVVSQDGIESDDVIAYLAQNLEGERYILSNDGDLAVLVGGGIHLIKAGATDPQPFGPFPHRFITLYKALVGDSSDKYPGAKGFGEKAFFELYAVFDDEGLEALEDLVKTKRLDRLAEDVAEFPKLQKIMDSAKDVYLCWDLARLYPEKVNTLRNPLKWRAGMVRGLDVVTDERLRKWARRVRLVYAGNYQEAYDWAKDKIAKSPCVALDIETSTPEESDSWLEARKRRDSDADTVDVFGSRLTGLGLTFGDNLQYDLYLTVDHAEEDDVKNITVDQCRAFVELVPKEKILLVQNVAFELPILYQTWGKHWKDDPDWHGFLPNCRDTKIMANYVDENQSTGLKPRAKLHLGYDQQTYAEVTTIDGVRYKMNQLTARHVLSYGADDTRVTADLYTFYRARMELEKTWHVFEEVETLPAYVTALAFVQGTPISLERMRELEQEDDDAYEKAWATVRQFLIERQWEGTVCPNYTEFTPAIIKEVFQILTGEELKSQVRTISKYPALLEEAGANLLAEIVARQDLAALNDLVKARFDGEPKLDINSPRQMRALLYGELKIPLRIINDVTAKERKEKPDLAAAVGKFNKIRRGSSNVEPLTDEEYDLLKVKAKTDDTAIESAIAFDADKVNVPVLKALLEMKKIDTRRKLFYRPYQFVCHWKDNLVHANLNQCATVTRRYSSSGPNLQQLPKKGEGLKFREIFLPHHNDAVVCSIDFSGQELRLMADQSQDKNLLACYIGEKKKDPHSITSAGAMERKWGKEYVKQMAERYGIQLESLPAEEVPEAKYDLFVKLRKSDDDEVAKKADDLRKDCKNVNFAAQYDAQAPKLAETLIIPLEDAQTFLDAKIAMFPDVEVWKDEVRAFVKEHGYAKTLMGARRHLRDAVLSDDKWEAERAGRQGPNFVIQGSSAEQTKLAMTRLWRSGALFKYDVRFLAPIHDELVTSVAIKDAVEFIRIKHWCMTQPYSTMKVPAVGSISLGPNFGEQHEVGDTFDEQAIREALEKCMKKEVASA